MDTIVKPNDDGSYLIALSGAINEYANAAFRRLLLQISTATSIEIDLGRVDIINSIGTIYWVDLLKTLLKIAPVTLSNCSFMMVDYLGRLPAMMHGAQVSSIQVPYKCPQCSRIFSHFLLVKELDSGKFEPVRCPKCSTPSEAEVEFEDYTSFRLNIDDVK